ncbi:MAG: hypothetical protein C0438_03860 [Pseudomonas sp.]|nr:hypothetical protein [Pseudomonas sp.]
MAWLELMFRPVQRDDATPTNRSEPHVGASLLAKASVQATSMLTVPTSSRAGSLPLGISLLSRWAAAPADHNNHKKSEVLPWPLTSKIAALHALPCAVQVLPNAGFPIPGYSRRWP